MAIKTLMDEIEADVVDVTNTTFEYINTNNVPNRSDNQLTFERNVGKKGKLLKTCVLYVDIRNSVALTEKHHNQTMGRIYSAFTKAVLKAAKHHSGHIRNIIGDRVMIIFPSNKCFTNAVKCAITINHIAKHIITKKFKDKDVDFKCGIGIDYGELRVIKVGIQRRGHEGTENKSLVWVGYPANIASRLTDMANKKFEEEYFEVTRNKINPRSIKPYFNFRSLYSLSPTYDPLAPKYLSEIEKVELTLEQFANEISSVREGELYMKGGKFINFEKKKKPYDFPAILMTKDVFTGYKRENPEGNDIKGDYWKQQTQKIKDVNEAVYGSNLHWSIN